MSGSLSKVIFSESATSDGREGRVKSANLDLKLEMHVDHGGPGGAPNPEELFAAGYAACFNGALQFQAAQHNIECGPSESTAVVDFGLDDSGVGLAVKLKVVIEGVDAPTATKLAELAHSFCPYSKAVDGNIDVEVTATPRLD
jgi:Ohr subfamily peroxiredoxin